MFMRHVWRQLAAHIDGELSRQKGGQVELHLERCAECRAKREEVRFGMEILEHLPSADAPDAIWTSIEAALQEHRSPVGSPVRRWSLAFAAAAMLALVGAAYWAVTHRSEARWDVMRVDGSPTVNGKHIGRMGRRIGAGEWIETDSGSSATVKVGEIGSVEVEPNTRLRVVTAKPGEHRLALSRGEIQAKITAPPRLFFVETASGTAVDLGCEYTLNAGEDGFGSASSVQGLGLV